MKDKAVDGFSPFTALSAITMCIYRTRHSTESWKRNCHRETSLLQNRTVYVKVIICGNYLLFWKTLGKGKGNAELCGMVYFW